MSDKPTDSAGLLHRRAEERMRGEGVDEQALSAADTGRLVHELRSHQIELEMQNEELRRAQEDLVATRERYVDLYDFAPVGYLTLSEKDLILEANLTSAKLFGVDRSALLGMPLSHFIVDKDQDSYYLMRRKLLETREHQTGELRMKKKNGDEFSACVECTVEEPCDADGVRFRLSVSDITERKQAEEIIKIDLALQRVRNEVLQMDAEESWKKVILGFYGELERLVAFTDCSINLVDRQNDRMTLYIVDPEHKVMRKEEPIPSVLKGVTETNQYLYRSSRADPFFGDMPETIHSVIDLPFLGGTLAVNSTRENAFSERDIRILEQFSQVMSGAHRRLQDITERQQMERELIRLERLRAVGELSAGVSHNLNNILTTVLGPAQILKRKISDPELLREVDDILTSAVRARDLVHELHMSVRTTEEEILYSVAVDQVVQQAVQTSRPRWKDEPEARGVAIEMVTRWGDVPSIQGTEAGLHNILTNLIFNAVDAMPEGGTITIQTQRLENQVRITFSDTGTGMDEATRLRIFEPFFTTKMDIGTGLGLSTVYNMVTRWGGVVEVDSCPGKGTTFTLRFPVWAEEKVEEKGKAAVQSTRSGKILVVDDDEGICRLLSRLLGELHAVEAVGSGRQALERFTPGKYDVVLIDLGLPGLPGNQVAREMMRVDAALVTVLITGWDLDPDDSRVTLLAGDPRLALFDFHIEKPFGDLDEVEAVVARAIVLHDGRVGDKELL